MRAEASQEALNIMGNGLETAANNLEIQKQKELSSITSVVNGQKLTRKQIEAEIITLSDKVYNIEILQLEPLQQQADLKRQLLSDLAFQIDREQKSLQINGMTRNEWNFIQQYVEASNKNANSLKTNIDLIASSSTTAAEAWESILSSMKSASLFKNSANTSSSPAGYVGTVAVSAAQIAANEAVGATIADLEKTASPWMFGGSSKPSSVKTPSVKTPSVGTPSAADALRRLTSGYSLSAAEKKVLGMSSGGMVPKYFSVGGFAKGTDTVPAMLTPGEFVMNRSATQEFLPMLSMLNESKYPSMIGAGNNMQVPVNNVSTSMSDNSTAVYNYSLGFNINGTNSNPNDIARAVMREIKNVDSQRIRGQRL
jgi:hypothetical protein